MNIGILTFHMAHNCGAMLQACALCKFLRDTFLHNCEIIDYRLPEIYQKYYELLQTGSVSPRRLKMERYLNTLPRSPRVNNVSDIKKYDMYIIGSDQVWNPQITKGYKDIYFGKFFPRDAYCITYAVSAGDGIANLPEFVLHLGDINRISVRESYLRETLASYWNEPIAWCLDPVFLVDKQFWDRYRFSLDIMPQSYMLIYAFNITDVEYAMIDIHAQQAGQTLLELYTHTRYRDNKIQCIENYGPREFVNYIHNAAYVYTDSYHGVLFSIIYQKPFFFLTHGRNIDARVYDIIKRLEIEKDTHGFYRASKDAFIKLQKGKMESKQYLEHAFRAAQNAKTDI